MRMTSLAGREMIYGIMGPSTKKILIVEDHAADVTVIKAALRRLNYDLEVQFISDGRLALDYLAGKRPYSERASYPLPHLILLDLSLPKVSGFEILEWVRTEPNLRLTPIIILATSNRKEDIQRAYAFGANSFITKPTELDKLVQDLKLAFDHWLFGQAVPLPLQKQAPPAETQPPMH